MKWSSKLVCLACSQGWWSKTRESQRNFQGGAAETLQQSFSGQQRRQQSLLKRCSSLLDFTHDAHGESLDPQRMQCGPRLAPSWSCSDWTVELNLWSPSELVGNCVARPSAHCCASGALASLLDGVCGISWADHDFSLEWELHMAYLSELFSFTVLNICAVTIMHDVPGEEWVQKFEVIYLRL